MKLAIHPLTPDRWPALAELFSTNNTCSRCWCMFPRIGSTYRKVPPQHNKDDLHEIVKRGPPPGLLAFDGDLAVGWCQLTPRDAVSALDLNWRLRRVDDMPVWSISCFFIRVGYRKKGVATALIEAALKAAKRAKAPALEAYPLDAALSPSSSSTGYATTFARAGFKEIARHFPPRPIMRYDFTT